MLLVAHRTPATQEDCAGFAAAGVTVFEVDVQLRDQALVVSHFLPLLRSGPVADRVEHDNWTFRRAGRPDPTLDEVLDRIPGGAGVLLDPKLRRGDDAAALGRALATRAGPDPRFVVSTDGPVDLDRYRAAGLRTWRTCKNRTQLAAVLARGSVPDEGFSVRHTLLDAETVSALHERAGTIVAWTVNDPRRARQLAGWGVDGLTTDHPDRIAPALGRIRGTGRD